MLTPYIIPISGRKSRGKNEKFVTNFKILPSRTPGLGICLRHEAIRLVIARSEATWQSRSTRLDNRAVSANMQAIAGDCRVGLRPPRNDKLGSITPINLCRKYCHPARRSLSAATPHTSVHAILTMPCTSRRFTAGPGCPLPYSTPRSAGFFSIVPYSPGKIHPVGKKRSLSVKSMEKRLKTGPFCDTINLYQNECTARRRGLHLHTDTTIIGGKHHECSRDHGTAQRIFL